MQTPGCSLASSFEEELHYQRTLISSYFATSDLDHQCKDAYDLFVLVGVHLTGVYLMSVACIP